MKINGINRTVTIPTQIQIGRTCDLMKGDMNDEARMMTSRFEIRRLDSLCLTGWVRVRDKLKINMKKSSHEPVDANRRAEAPPHPLPQLREHLLPQGGEGSEAWRSCARPWESGAVSPAVAGQALSDRKVFKKNRENRSQEPD